MYLIFCGLTRPEFNAIKIHSPGCLAAVHCFFLNSRFGSTIINVKNPCGLLRVPSYVSTARIFTVMMTVDGNAETPVLERNNGDVYKRQLEILKVKKAVSYTHLDVYKRQFT